MKDAMHAYIAKRPGQPGCYAACVDMQDHAKETSKFITEVVKEGGIIERVTTEQAGAMLQEYFKWRKLRDKEIGQAALI